MPMILTPQRPLSPTLSVHYAWNGQQGAEVLDVEVVEAIPTGAPQDEELTGAGTEAGTETTTTVVAEYSVDFSALGAADEFQGVVLPAGVPAWCDVVIAAERAADGTLTVMAVNWDPDAHDTIVQKLPWEEEV